MKNPVIALLTDFGDKDFFVASMKGVILSINPQARIIDISHSVPAFDIQAAGFILTASSRFFPPETIFVAVVDPGVGSGRRILLTACGDYFFIAPDNGILDPVMATYDTGTVWEITHSDYFLSGISRTFEARDKMAPAAAWLSRGEKCEKFGPEIVYTKRTEWPRVEISAGRIRGRIVYTDKFGNLITNIPEERFIDFRDRNKNERVVLRAGNREIYFADSYSAAAKGDLLFLPGSLGYLEIACREGSAAEELELKSGDAVVLALLSES